MSFDLHQPEPPVSGAHDAARKIGRRVWHLQRLQDALRAEQVALMLSSSASNDLATDLFWDMEDVRQFFLSLESHRYRSSAWCLPPKQAKTAHPSPADVYVMGYDRFSREECQRRPPIYIKFALKQNLIYVFSLHFSRLH